METHNVYTPQRCSRLLVAGLLGLSMAGVMAARLPTARAESGICPTTDAELQGAITSAGSGGTVRLACGSPTTITFFTPITVSQKVRLDAGGSPAAITFDGQNNTGLFDVQASLLLNNLRLSNGAAGNGDGAIVNEGTLTVSNSTFSHNSSEYAGGAILTVLARPSPLPTAPSPTTPP